MSGTREPDGAQTVKLSSHEAVRIRPGINTVGLELIAFGMVIAARQLTREQARFLGDALGFASNDSPLGPRCTGNCNQGRNCTCKVAS